MNIINKSLLFAVFGIITIASSCKDEDTISMETIDESSEVYTARCGEIETNQLKTYIKNTGEQLYSASWVLSDTFVGCDDEKKVAWFYRKTSLNDLFSKKTVVKGADGSNLLAPTPSHIVYAYYPKRYFKSYEGNGVLNVVLPDTQKYVSDKELDTNLFPMFCSSTDGTFTFKNVAAIICVNVVAKEEGLQVKSVSLGSSVYNMCGDAKVHLNASNTPVLNMADLNSGEEPKKALIWCNTPVELKKGVKVPFHMVIPPYDYPKGSLTITIETNKYTGTYNVTNGWSISRSSANIYTKNLLLTLSSGGIYEGDEPQIAD